MKQLFFILILFASTVGCSSTDEKKVKRGIKGSSNLLKQTENIIKDVEVEKFAALIEKEEGQVLDVRTPDEWESGVIKGAIKINFYDSDFKNQIEKLDKGKAVLVYCKSGGRSAKAAEQLKEEGFQEIYNLLGGIIIWRSTGREIK